MIAIDKESFTSGAGFDRTPGIVVGGPCATLQTNGVHAVCYDARGNGDGSVINTLTGGHESSISDYTSVVVEPTVCLQGNGIDRADNAGCNGKGWKEDICYTLNTIDRPAVVYSNQAYDKWEPNEAGATLRATGGIYGGGSENLVQANYIVRRLTPTECARLQGFADRWGDIDAVDRMSAKDYQFWKEVRNTHDVVIKGKDPKDLKDYTVKQMVAWYNKLQTDSSEYKMWGNGIALPTALYVLQGIADVLSRTRYDGYNTETAFCDEPEDDDSWMN